MENEEYIKATIHTTSQGVEALAGALFALGIESYSVEDHSDLESIIASKDKLAWDFAGADDSGGAPSGTEESEARISFWLTKDDSSETFLQTVKVALLKLKSDEQYGAYGDDVKFGRLWLQTEVEGDDWKYRYKESFRTFSPCEGIVISPPWEDGSVVSDQWPVDSGTGLRLIIDPGMAFGTGLHETTSMCLARLKELLRPGDRVLDAGTGSGILAIAAALLGAGEVVAVDKDEDAIFSAKRNIDANGAGEKIRLLSGDLSLPGMLQREKPFDLILANLSYPLLKTLLPTLLQVLEDDGTMVLSGLLDTQVDGMCETIKSHGLEEASTKTAGDWAMMEIRK